MKPQDHWLVWVRGVVVSFTYHETSDHWLVWVRGVVVSNTCHETLDHWLLSERNRIIHFFPSEVAARA